MLSKILPDNIYSILKEKVNFKSINEIRLRSDKPILLNLNGKSFFLSELGATSNIKNALFASKIMVEDVIFRASECSIYSVNEQIKRGYIVTNTGVRLGLGGNLIEEKGQIKTMANFSSCNIRIPHSVKNFCLNAFPFMVKDGFLFNSLVISPPGCGKTTFLKDFVEQLSERNLPFNVLLLDERGELDCQINSNFCDKIAFSSKKVGFENGIRALSPDVIVADEIGQAEDIEAIEYASRCGVNILASCHCDSIENFVKKPLFEKLIKEKIFKRYILLSNRNGPGTYEGIYDENFSRLFVDKRW